MKHAEDNPWTLNDAVGLLCLIGTIAYLIWLCWSVWEVV